MEREMPGKTVSLSLSVRLVSKRCGLLSALSSESFNFESIARYTANSMYQGHTYNNEIQSITDKEESGLQSICFREKMN